jgi:hypothetical protein
LRGGLGDGDPRTLVAIRENSAANNAMHGGGSHSPTNTTGPAARTFWSAAQTASKMTEQRRVRHARLVAITAGGVVTSEAELGTYNCN